MFPVFTVLIICCAVIAWFLLNGLFKIVGTFAKKILDDTKNNLKGWFLLSKAGAVGGFVVAAVLVVGVGGAIMCSEMVPAGHVGIQYTMSGGV